jgi:hypothetical protein
MTMPSGARDRYRIVIRGECGQLLAGVLDELAIESGRGWTSVVASVRDECELYGFLDRLQDFGLRIVGLNLLGAGALRPRTGIGGRE